MTIRNSYRLFSTASSTVRKLPPGFDKAASFPKEHHSQEAKKWKRFSLAFGLVVAGVAAYLFPKELEHHEVYIPPEYPFIDRKVKEPRFPWGNEPLIGTPYDRVRRSEQD
ncbi:hypothetical protein Gasu2_44480 [Galdieria sulphuraria]|uniref:Uncharacterized protein n=1 Tax=Galdieria sulphuraria TaxID=130081 RepID=M2W6S8_GALSU|nr:uncharacterized protein Gasu_11790 [Galdieria sulphuraria]EME31501.1 hypothetical protein Gasu_11790 [Galdieria sulphuraria]GJD10244.1 hypothetical protein Gasu2_44480 [Galdieria sulphuraria]|eukprot:XP_005708021.1 hypothetical protein Gasu_11790 [Galdieria sulphuraria]